MTLSPKTPYARINLERVLESRRQIALIWAIEDVQSVRPDLDGNQAWEVLQACKRNHDCNYGMSWEYIEIIAENLFPAPDDKEDGHDD